MDPEDLDEPLCIDCGLPDWLCLDVAYSTDPLD